MKVFKMKNIIVVLAIMVLILIVIFFAQTMKNSGEKTVFTNTNVAEIEKLNNTKIGWGIKRADNHKQPDLGSKNKALMEKYNGLCMGSSEKPYIYLTFDAGYEAGYTEKILEVLKQNQVSATFFITAHYLNTQPDLVKRMIDENHIVSNHTVNHRSMPDCSLDTIQTEVMNLHTAIYEKFGYEMKYIRPPKGEYSERTLAYCNSLNYKTVMWSFAYDDWDENNQGREEYGKKKILDNLHNGEIMLLHSTSKDNSNILDEIIKEAKNQGYEFKSLDEFEL